MKSARTSSPSRVKLFDNSFFERFTVFPLAGFLLIWPVLLVLVAAVAAAQHSPDWLSVGMVFAGWLTWTATEYFLHRVIFHLEPESGWLKRTIFVIHGNHHAEPNDALRNLMPPIVSVPVVAAIWALCVSLIGAQGSWFCLGFVVGYVIYDLIHYCCHQMPMKSPLARLLKVHHMRHHFWRDGGNYAITGMFWDRLFATHIRGKTGNR